MCFIADVQRREQILSRAQELRETKVDMELFPMIAPLEEFDTDIFWQDLLKGAVTEDDKWQYEGSQIAARLSVSGPHTQQPPHMPSQALICR